MTMQYDVESTSLAASGSIFGDRTRIKGLLVIPGASAGSVVLKDGGSGGTTVMTIATAAAGAPFNVLVPGEGILFLTNAYATLTNASLVAFYG